MLGERLDAEHAGHEVGENAEHDPRQDGGRARDVLLSEKDAEEDQEGRVELRGNDGGGMTELLELLRTTKQGSVAASPALRGTKVHVSDR